MTVFMVLYLCSSVQTIPGCIELTVTPKRQKHDQSHFLFLSYEKTRAIKTYNYVLKITINLKICNGIFCIPLKLASSKMHYDSKLPGPTLLQ